MRFLVLLGLGLLACGGTATSTGESGPIPVGIRVGGSAGVARAAGGPSVVGSAGEAPSSGGTASDVATSGGGAGGPPAVAAGADSGGSSGHLGATAGTSSGGTSGAAASDAGAGGESGAPPAPDDTGCIDRPWTGNLSNLSEQLPGFDCARCSTAAAMGYSTPAFCADVTSCAAAVDVTTLPHDVFVLLPAGAAQRAPCHEQNCADASGAPADLPGFTLQLMLNVPIGHTVKIETDGARRVLKRDLPLIKCAEAASCYAYGSQAQFAIVVTPYAPRGWVRIKVDTGDTCQ